MAFRLIANERAAVVGDYLVVSDLHIGYEATLEERGIRIPNTEKTFLLTLNDLKSSENVSKLIILGDIKHNIGKISSKEIYDIPNFFYSLAESFQEVVVVKGNHDGLIEKMVHPKNIAIVPEFSVGEVGFVHGNRWPSKELMEKVSTLFIAHMHPSVKIVNIYGKKVKRACWLMFNVKKTLNKKYLSSALKRVVVMPPLNTFMQGTGELSGVMASYLRDKEIYLLDLTKIK